ncbi:hypothetical protein GPB2148_2159 [marine gamma proteobacterium HTCC2148]|jgi:hypothetical protein|nr:hypothetical protein GPB2148_2159 [marine gamma proteobacterium HTCC2148]MBT3410267.1 hypothetical protein [Halieaceae bacterium]MDG1387512.1 hypothetical protein [Halioglobus sp.]MBT5007623.1 hypothetical protein [Halieaceae bacterium]MBT6125133.1 hypothetical protein [Halieaceae bacterium]
MANRDYSEAAFLDFLRQGTMAGLIRPGTARSRKKAAEQLLVQLKSNERVDLRQLDIDELCTRFHKLQGSTIRPETLQIYNDRLQAGLRDFFSWIEDPNSFSSDEGETSEIQLVAERDSPDQSRAREELLLNPPRSPHEIFPVPIRENLVVYIQNLPLDLTPAEADRIARVVRALANPGEAE